MQFILISVPKVSLWNFPQISNAKIAQSDCSDKEKNGAQGIDIKKQLILYLAVMDLVVHIN